MPEPHFLWISEAEVAALMDIGEAIEALRKGLLAEAQGCAENMVKTHVEWSGGGTLHAIGAAFPLAGFAGTKTWAHTPGGATPLLVLYDSNNGAMLAVVEAFALGQMRTATTSGLATQHLAHPDADELAMIGAGQQALAQVAAVLAVRPIRRVRAYSRNEQRRRQFVERVETEFAVEAVPAESVREAVQGAAVVTLATRANDPILSAETLERGTHINAIGAIVPTRAEVAADVVARATQIVADSIPQAQKLSRELIEALGCDAAQWRRVQSLANLVAGNGARAASDDLTLFKSLGMGISDLALAIEIYRKAVETGAGRKLPHPQKVSPRLRISEPEPARKIAGG